MKSYQILTLIPLFLTLPSTLLAQQAPKPPEPDEIRLRGEEDPARDSKREKPRFEAPDQPIHNVEPFEEDGIKVYRYPTVGRAGEIALQGMGGMIAELAALIIIDDVFYWELRDKPGLLYSSTALTTGLSSALLVHGLGHNNGSRSELLATLAGGLAGSSLATFFFYSSNELNRDIIPYDLMEGSLFLLPSLGAILGYQIFSSWKTNKTRKATSIAASPPLL